MNKKTVTGILIGSGVIALLFLISSGNSSTQAGLSVGDNNQNVLADRIEVVHFHGTRQCFSCITVGKYALKTIKERFSEEYENGRIVFRDVNGELPENRNIVVKYRATGSSLFVNAIASSTDNITEDVTVWRLVSNENNFMNYFETKLKELLGKS